MRNLFIISAAIGIASCASADTMYKCGNSYSQTPCGANQVVKQIKSQTNACENETTKYTSACDYNDFIKDLDKKSKLLKKQLFTKLKDITPEVKTIQENKSRCAQGVLDRLKDPDSAKLSAVTRIGTFNDYEAGKVVARNGYQLTVNAKNGFGGYTGQKIWNCAFSTDEKELIRISARDEAS